MRRLLLSITALLALIPLTTLAQTGDPAPTSTCLTLQHNMGYRATDASTGGEVSALQDYLHTKGLLDSTPTGYYGLHTSAAVKSLQAGSGLTATGYVGPYTRGKILLATCGGATSTNTNTTNTANTNTTTNTNTTGSIVIPPPSPYAGTYASYEDLVKAMLKAYSSGVTTSAANTATTNTTSGGTTGTSIGTTANVNGATGTTAVTTAVSTPQPIPSMCLGRNVVAVKNWNKNSNEAPPFCSDCQGLFDFWTKPKTVHVIEFKTDNAVYYNRGVSAFDDRGTSGAPFFISTSPCDLNTIVKKKDGNLAVREADGHAFPFISAPQAVFDKIQTDPALNVYTQRGTPIYTVPEILRLEPNTYYYANIIDDASVREMFGLDAWHDVNFKNTDFDHSAPIDPYFSAGGSQLRIQSLQSVKLFDPWNGSVMSNAVIPGYTDNTVVNGGVAPTNTNPVSESSVDCPYFYSGAGLDCTVGGNSAEIKSQCCPNGVITSCTAGTGGIRLVGKGCVVSTTPRHMGSPAIEGKEWLNTADLWGLGQTPFEIGHVCVGDYHYDVLLDTTATGAANYTCSSSDPTFPKNGGCYTPAQKMVQICK